jgi:transposase-like protein
LYIVEINEHITRAYAIVIENKKQNTIVPIICAQVNSGSIIHTDEHDAYFKLSKFSFNHGTVCHKYEFVNSETGVHTQGIESFHNELKLEIKKRKGIKTENRVGF